MTVTQKPAGTGAPSDRSPVPAAEDWREQALCAGIGDFLFFAEAGQEQFTKRAKAICRSCPVTEPCLEFALEVEAVPDGLSRQGVYGGLSARERRDLKRTSRKAAA